MIRLIWFAIIFSISFFCKVSNAQGTDFQRDRNLNNSPVFAASACFSGLAGEDKPIVLSGGARAILRPEPDAELTAISVCIRMEPDLTIADAATGEMTVRALFGSSSNRSRSDILDSLRRVGGSLETQKTQEMVSITLLTLPEQVREAIYLISESLKNADFSKESLDRALKSILESKLRRDSNAFLSAFSGLKAALQGGLSPEEADYRRVSTLKADQYFRARYLPERTIIAITGKFDPKTVLKSLDNNLVDFDRKSARAFTRTPVFRGFAPLSLQPLRQYGDSAVAMIACAAPGVSDRDYPAFLTLQALLGGGHSSRLFRQIRELRGVGYGVGALYNTQNSDPLILYLQWDTKIEGVHAQSITPENALAMLNSQLDSVLTNPPSEAELARAKSVAIGRDALQYERIRNRCFLTAMYEAIGPGYDFGVSLSELINQVGRNDIKRVVERYLKVRTSILTLPKKSD